MNLSLQQMPIRVPRELHQELQQAAQASGMSLNQYCLYLLARHGLRSTQLQKQKAEDLMQFVAQAQYLGRALRGEQGKKTEPPKETPAQRWRKLHGRH